MELHLRSSGVLGPNSAYRLYSQTWTAKECDRLLGLVRDWLEQDNYERGVRDQWRGMSCG